MGFSTQGGVLSCFITVPNEAGARRPPPLWGSPSYNPPDSKKRVTLGADGKAVQLQNLVALTGEQNRQIVLVLAGGVAVLCAVHENLAEVITMRCNCGAVTVDGITIGPNAVLLTVLVTLEPSPENLHRILSHDTAPVIRVDRWGVSPSDT